MPDERKLVTILFADVTGSTALGEALDPEDVRALMGRYYEHARRIIAEHSGTLEKFIGDAVMAVFGLPHAHGNDAERALAAALALRATVAGDPVLAGRLLLRIGVNTGEVVATRDPSAGDFLVTGDAVNVAARLQQAAHPGEILAGERTQAAGDVAFHFAAVRSTEVKGKSRPLSVFPLVGPRPVRALSRPPLVGRRRELAQLSLLCDAALQEHQPQLASVVAPAGTGKTRLVEEFLSRLDPAESWRAATARCLPYGQTLTYWPLRGLLDELLGTRFSLERVTEMFATGGHSQGDAQRLAGLLLASLGIESQELAERESIFAAWRLLVEGLARQAPHIVVFEDLHWASESLLDLVEHIMHPRTRAPLLIVVLSRPELLDRRPSWGGGRRNFTALTLDTLSEAQTHQLIDQLVPDLQSEAVRERIVERSGGNPFFAIELARGLAARLADQSASDGVALPDTVHEAVLARLDQLSEPEREVLQVAAVAGRTFHPPILRAGMPERDPAAIAAALEGLLARDLLTPAEGEEGAYTFRHILFREVAYGTLSRVERIRLHMAIARWLEDFARERLDEFVELLAYHYREAVLFARQSAVPLNVEVDAAQAVRYLERAAEVAVQTEAFIEAERFLHSALALAPEADHIRLYEKLGDSYPALGLLLDAYRSALERWPAADVKDPGIGARLLRKVLISCMRFPMSTITRPSDDEMVSWRTEARRLAEAVADEDELWRVRVGDLFWPYWHQDSVTSEAAKSERAIGLAAAAHFESRGDQQFLSIALDGSAILALTSGAHREVIQVSMRRLAIPGLPPVEHCDALCLIAWSYCYLGEYEQSIAVVREALGQLRPGDPFAYLAEPTSFALLAGLFSGRWTELSDLADLFMEALERRQHTFGVAAVRRGYLALLHLALAREDGAAASAAVAVLERELQPDLRAGERADLRAGERALFAAYRDDDLRSLDFDPAGVVWPVAYPFVWMLMFLSERGAQTTPALLDIAARRARRECFDALLRCVAIAEALAANDNGCLASAIDEAEAHGLIPHAARMRVVLAQRTGDFTQLERARPVLERLGDQQFLHRLDEIAAILR